MNNFDFNSYDLDISKYYDGFIDSDGRFYRVKKKGMNEDLHNKWAFMYIHSSNDSTKIQININCLFSPNNFNIKSFTDLLIDVFGFTYYSHDSIYLKPIIRFPNPVISDKRASCNQVEAIVKILKINNEELKDKEFILDANKFYYNELVYGGYIKNENNTNKRFEKLLRKGS